MGLLASPPLPLPLETTLPWLLSKRITEESEGPGLEEKGGLTIASRAVFRDGTEASFESDFSKLSSRFSAEEEEAEGEVAVSDETAFPLLDSFVAVTLVVGGECWRVLLEGFTGLAAVAAASLSLLGLFVVVAAAALTSSAAAVLEEEEVATGPRELVCPAPALLEPLLLLLFDRSTSLSADA